MSDKPPRISNKVWRKGWRREAAATQAASAELAACLNWLEQNRYGEIANIIRQFAMQYGVRKTEPAFRSALRSISGKRP
jgi:hypothetical protein